MLPQISAEELAQNLMQINVARALERGKWETARVA